MFHCKEIKYFILTLPDAEGSRRKVCYIFPVFIFSDLTPGTDTTERADRGRGAGAGYTGMPRHRSPTFIASMKGSRVCTNAFHCHLASAFCVVSHVQRVCKRDAAVYGG